MLRAHRDIEFSNGNSYSPYFVPPLPPLLLYHPLFNSVQRVNRYTNCKTEQWFLLDRWYFTRPLSICAGARDQRAKSLISSGNHIVVYFVRRGICPWLKFKIHGGIAWHAIDWKNIWNDINVRTWHLIWRRTIKLMLRNAPCNLFES